MKKIKCFVLAGLLMILPVVLMAQPMMATGQEWTELSREEKIAFVEGFTMGLIAAGNLLVQYINEYFSILSYQVNFQSQAEQIVDMIDDVLRRYPTLSEESMVYILMVLQEAAANPGLTKID